jgi:hypothetical protein
MMISDRIRNSRLYSVIFLRAPAIRRIFLRRLARRPSRDSQRFINRVCEDSVGIDVPENRPILLCGVSEHQLSRFGSSASKIVEFLRLRWYLVRDASWPNVDFRILFGGDVIATRQVGYRVQKDRWHSSFVVACVGQPYGIRVSERTGAE